MKVGEISISWFRGASDLIKLDTKGKSIVVYGENGAGKSSFVDAVEYLVNDHKVTHLSHEYSGRRQEKGLINSHTPEGAKTTIGIKLANGDEVNCELTREGLACVAGAEDALNWDYHRTILRQNEVAEFIVGTKGEKYSVLLPLLGLEEMEVAAENLRQLARAIERNATFRADISTIDQASARRKEHFDGLDDDGVVPQVIELANRYSVPTDGYSFLGAAQAVVKEIDDRLSGFDAEKQREFIFETVAGQPFKSNTEAIRSASATLANAVEPLLSEKLAALNGVSEFADAIGDEGDVKCPACGRLIPAKAFQAHVKGERERLDSVMATFKLRGLGIEGLRGAIRAIRTNLGKAEVSTWKGAQEEGPLAREFEFLTNFDLDQLTVSCDAQSLDLMETMISPVLAAASAQTKSGSLDVSQMAKDSQVAEAASAVLQAAPVVARVKQIKNLIAVVQGCEHSIRGEIRAQSNAVVEDISNDVQDMWDVLHPGEAIDEIKLYLPDEADKAIDIGLRFHGVSQESPRLTLSEGHRNSLGLCLFLAMAKRDMPDAHPVFFDDVVVSLDRGHRGMIASLLEKRFSDRQLVVFTHDREWFAELRQQLDSGRWSFVALMPYATPEVGIRWSAKTSTLDDGRAVLDTDPDRAGNIARKIMDVELALAADRLKLKMPYLYRERNDHRVAHDFISRLVGDGRKCLQIQRPTGYECYEEALEAFREADRLLVTWGNKSSHSFDVVRAEAEALISVCESALSYLQCPNCGKAIYRLEDGQSELVQCSCGHVRWAYGKV